MLKVPPLFLALSVAASGQGVIPQIAASGSFQNGGFLTLLNIVNTTEETTTTLLTFYDAAGDYLPMVMSEVDLNGSPCLTCLPAGEASSLSVGLLPGESAQVALLPSGEPRIGYAAVGGYCFSCPLTQTGSAPIPGPIAVTATFMQIVPGRPDFMTGMAPSKSYVRAFLSTSDRPGFTSSLALVATGLQGTQNVTLTFRDPYASDGCSASFPLSDFNHRAFVLRALLPCIIGKDGSVEINTDGAGFAGVGIWAHDSGGFVSQPLWGNQVD